MEPMSALEFGASIGISTRSIRDLVARGVITRDAQNLFPWPQANLQYTAHLRELAAGRGGSAAATISAERARLLRARADAAENENRQAAGEFVPAAEVEREWSARFRNIRVGLLSVVQRLAGLLPHLSRADLALVDAEMRRTLSDIADGEWDT